MQILTQAHGKKAMLKYMHLLAKSPVACEKFVRGGGASVCFDLTQQEAQRKDVMFVLRKMLQGSMPSVRTELTTQMEEQGYITAIFEILKNKGDPVPLKVAAVEVIKAMQDDEDEATSEAVKASVERYPEVTTLTHFAFATLAVATFASARAEPSSTAQQLRASR